MEVTLFQNERPSSLLNAILIAIDDSFASFSEIDREGSDMFGEQDTGCQVNEVVRIRQLVCFVKVVHPPTQPGFGVPPSPEILDVQIANGS